jgi:hypothetical protein
LNFGRDTKNNCGVDLIVVAIATTITFVVVIVLLERWGFNGRLGAVFGGG